MHCAVIDVLLDGRIAGLQNGGQRLRHAANYKPRRPEIKQHRCSGATHENVVGRYVAVEDVLRMQQRERVHDRLQQASDAGFVKIFVGQPPLA